MAYSARKTIVSFDFPDYPELALPEPPEFGFALDSLEQLLGFVHDLLEVRSFEVEDSDANSFGHYHFEFDLDRHGQDA